MLCFRFKENQNRLQRKTKMEQQVEIIDSQNRISYTLRGNFFRIRKDQKKRL